MICNDLLCKPASLWFKNTSLTTNPLPLYPVRALTSRALTSGALTSRAPPLLPVLDTVSSVFLCVTQTCVRRPASAALTP